MRDAMAKKKQKTRTVTARVIGPIPDTHSGGSLFWTVRLAAPYLPFYLDSSTGFASKHAADAFAARWRKRRVRITVRR
jgi:hypothetical protein